MKKIALLSLGLFPAFAFAASSGTFIGTGGNWTTGSNWESGAYPELAADNTYNITFTSNNTDLALKYAGVYKSGSNRTMYVYLGEDVENLTLRTSATSDAFFTRLDFSNITKDCNIYLDTAPSGANKVRFGGALQSGTNLYLNTTDFYTADWNATIRGHVHINVGTSEAPVVIQRFSGRGDITIAEDCALRATSAMNMQGDSTHVSKITMETGSYMYCEAGIKVSDADIYGNLIITGARPYSTADDSLNLYVNKRVVFRAGSTLVNTYNTPSGARPVINGTSSYLYSYANAGDLSSAQAMQLSNGGTLVLNSQNALSIGDGGEQNILVSQYILTTPSAGNIGDAATTGNLRIGLDFDTGNTIAVAKNTVDNLDLYADSTLNLWLGGNDLEVVHLTQLGDTSNPFSLVLQDDIARGSLIVQDFNGLVSVDDVRSYISTGAGTTGELFVESVSDSYYIYTVAVPEPAEWAFILGALVMSFVAYRRRK